LQTVCLIGRWQEFQLYGKFHYVSITQIARLCKQWAKAAQAGRFLRVPSGRLKLVGFHA
jgi:hypothetical protein